jgi:hypothetical protein
LKHAPPATPFTWSGHSAVLVMPLPDEARQAPRRRRQCQS